MCGCLHVYLHDMLQACWISCSDFPVLVYQIRSWEIREQALCLCILSFEFYLNLHVFKILPLSFISVHFTG